MEPVEQALALIRKEEFAAAERLLEGALASNGLAENADARAEIPCTLAVAQRRGQRIEAALATLDRLLAIRPDHARAHQERGHALLAGGRPALAMRAYGIAVHQNPALLVAWKVLVILHGLTGQRRLAAIAQAEVDYLDALPKDLLSVSSLIHEGQLESANRLCGQYLRSHPGDVECIRLLACIGEKLGMPADAEFLLQSALTLEPDDERCRRDYAKVLLKLQDFERAREQTQRLTEEHGDNLNYLELHASATAGTGQLERAIRICNEAIARSPVRHRLYVIRGYCEVAVGRFDDGVASFHRAYALQPDYGNAFWSLANTKTYRFTEAELAHMASYEARADTNSKDRIHLCFALGKAHEDRGEHERYFACYARGNALMRASVKPDVRSLLLRAAAQKRVCTQALFAARAGLGCPRPDPIFIVGLPRAGSTLVEQILASHTQVDGTWELPNIAALARRLGRRPGQERTRGYVEVLEEFDADSFLRRTSIHRASAVMLLADDLTCCKVRLNRPPARTPTRARRLERRRRKPVTDAGQVKKGAVAHGSARRFRPASITGKEPRHG